MTIDRHSSATSSLGENSQDLYPHSKNKRDRFREDRENLNDRTIIWRFAQGKKRLVVNQNLRINYAHKSLQLSTLNGELIAIYQVVNKSYYILVKKDNKYSDTIQEIISKCQFIPLDTANAERRFMRYQKYEIPADYTLRYEPAAQLWQMWQESQQLESVERGLDILILARSKWYRVQQMISTDDRLDLQTRLGLISLALRDRIAWIAKLGDISALLVDADLTIHQNVTNGGTDSDILGKIISRLAIEAVPDGNFYFEPNPDMPSSVFSQPDDSALLYDEGRTSILTENPSLPVLQELRASTIRVLEDYLEHGKTIVRTETIVDAQGNVISEKTVSTHHGCPRWAIEAIVHWR
jgi:hypothetical protein